MPACRGSYLSMLFVRVLGGGSKEARASSKEIACFVKIRGDFLIA